MAKAILIQLNAEDKATPQIKALEDSIKSLGSVAAESTKKQSKGFINAGNSATAAGSKTKKAMKESSSAAQSTTDTLEALGNQMRYLSLVTGTASALMISSLRGFISTAQETEEALLGIAAEANKFGRNTDEATVLAQKFAKTGLIPFGQSAQAIRNLLGTGLNIDQVDQAMNALINRAVVAKEVNYDLGTAVLRTTEGWRYNREQLFDATLIQGIFQKATQEAAATLGKNTNKVTEAEKQQAILNIVLRESANYMGLADQAGKLYTGILGKQKASTYELSRALGDSLKPALGALSEAVRFGADKMAEFIKATGDFGGIALASITALTTLATSISILGASLPIVKTAMTKFKDAIGLATLSLSKFALITAGVTVGIVTLTYLILKATGHWDKFKTSISEITKEFLGMQDGAEETGDSLEELDAKTKKALDDIEDKIFKTTRSFKEGLAEWSRDHKKAIKDIGDDLIELNSKYKDSMSDISDDYKDNQEDMDIAHARRVEDLQREIDEEVSKGIWADQTRIRDLKLRLKRENEDYARNSNKNKDRIEDETSKEKNEYDKRLKELSDKLIEESSLMKKHQDLLNSYKIEEVTILDEVDKKYRTFLETLVDLQEQYDELKESSSNSPAPIKTEAQLAVERQKQKIDELRKSYEEANRYAEKLSTTAGVFGAMFRDVLSGTLNNIKDFAIDANRVLTPIGEKILQIQQSTGGSVGVNLPSPIGIGGIDLFQGTINFFKGLLSPSPKGNAMGGPVYSNSPYLVGENGPELFVPRNNGDIVSNRNLSSGGSINININNPTVRNDSDIQRIADAVKQVMSREQSLRKYK